MKRQKNWELKTFGIKTSKEPNALYLRLVDDVIDFSQNCWMKFLNFLMLKELLKLPVPIKLMPFIRDMVSWPRIHILPGDVKKKISFLLVLPHLPSIKWEIRPLPNKLPRNIKCPCLQGSQGNVKDTKEAADIAAKIGYPVILKAAAGGGGRGMRIVEKASHIEKMFKMATSEAEKAFNDPSVFIEKYVRNPSHIEFQIVGDRHGNYIHLGERECSIQRKHQKLIEESPSVALDENLREKWEKRPYRLPKQLITILPEPLNFCSMPTGISFLWK